MCIRDRCGYDRLAADRRHQHQQRRHVCPRHAGQVPAHGLLRQVVVPRHLSLIHILAPREPTVSLFWPATSSSDSAERRSTPASTSARVRTVSYTPLDVYKRQGDHYPGLHFRGRDPRRAQELFHHLSALGHRSAHDDRVYPVSYTHLDVYKRQLYVFYARGCVWHPCFFVLERSLPMQPMEVCSYRNCKLSDQRRNPRQVSPRQRRRRCAAGHYVLCCRARDRD